MIKVAVCDDEIKHLELLSKYINKYTEEYGVEFEIYLFQSGKELMQIYQNDAASFDMIFLDIYLDLDKVNGMDVAKAIREKDKEVFILFLTSSKDYVFDGYIVNSFRYLVKPLTYEQFTREFGAVNKELQNSKEEVLFIETSVEIFKLSLCNIIYLESKGRKIKIVTTKNEIEFYGKLSYYSEKISNKGFLRINRSYIVNLLHIEEILRDNIELTNREKIYFNERKRSMIKREFLLFYTNERKKI